MNISRDPPSNSELTKSKNPNIWIFWAIRPLFGLIENTEWMVATETDDKKQNFCLVISN